LRIDLALGACTCKSPHIGATAAFFTDFFHKSIPAVAAAALASPFGRLCPARLAYVYGFEFAHKKVNIAGMPVSFSTKIFKKASLSYHPCHPAVI
jgi:hypothetical protein